MKLTTAQKKMIERMSRFCGDAKKSPDGYCEYYDVTDGHALKWQCLENLVKMGFVIKKHSKQKYRSCWGGSASSDNGFTLYRLAPNGIKYIYKKIVKEEQDNTLDKRIAKAVADLRITDEELSKAMKIKD